MSNQNRSGIVALFAAVAAFCLLTDLASKYAVGGWVQANNGPIVVVPGWLRFDYQLNQGALWSLGREHGALANAVLALFSAVVATAILVVVCFKFPGDDRPLAAVLGMIFGGAAGNLYDRILFSGVRDFIEVNLQFYLWPIFNLADSYLVCGAILVVLGSLFGRQAASAEATVGEPATPPPNA